MTIQISVTVWTVICFILLMVILHNWLFKPVLQLMDRRRERIEKAAARKAELEKTEQEYQAAFSAEKAARSREREQQLQQQLETLQSESHHAVELAKEERVRELDEYRDRAERERKEILATLEQHLPELVDTLAKSITKE